MDAALKHRSRQKNDVIPLSRSVQTRGHPLYFRYYVDSELENMVSNDVEEAENGKLQEDRQKNILEGSLLQTRLYVCMYMIDSVGT